jgi:RHS repeat-associated protein
MGILNFSYDKIKRPADDADGTRVAKGTISKWSCDPSTNGFTTTNDYVLGLGGEQVTEMGIDTTAGSSATTLAWQHTNVWAGGKLLGTYDKTGLHFYLDDPLGTRRAQTNYAGVLEQTCSSLPYGDALSCTGGDLAAPTEHHFTGKERDVESGNDYFEARYYSSAMGRFMSPDWSAKLEPVPYAKLDNPQSLNLYGYVRNNPLSMTDADGHQDDGKNGSTMANVKEYSDKAKSIYDNTAEGYRIAKEITGEYREAVEWGQRMQYHFDAWTNTQGKNPVLAHWHHAAYEYSQSLAMYHCYKVGVSLKSIEDGMYTPLISRMMSQLTNLVTSGTEQTLLKTANEKRTAFYHATAELAWDRGRKEDAAFMAKYNPFTDIRTLPKDEQHRLMPHTY